MRRFFFTILSMAVLSPAIAQQAPVKQDPAELLATGLTINDCLLILNGLNKLDEPRDVIVNKGKPGEAVVKENYEFAQVGVQLDISHNLALLGQVQREVQVPQQRVLFRLFRELPPMKGAKPGDPEVPAQTLPPGSKQAEEYDVEMRKLTDQPCRAQLAKIKAEDLLNGGKNKIAVGVLALIDKILVR